MRTRERIFRLTAVTLILGLAALSAWLVERNTALEEQLTVVREQSAAPQAPPTSCPERTVGTDLLTPPEWRTLRATGFDDPVAALRADLMNRPDLIPAEPSLGGTMGFYDPNGIHLLGDRWVMAEFEDGHNAGKLLLRYGVKGGTIHWEVLDVRTF